MTENESQQKEPRYDTRTLFGKARVVLIEHAGQIYRLMITRQGKLILNK